MAISFACENCGKQFRVDDKLAGKRAKCKKCSHSMVVPSPDRYAGLSLGAPPQPAAGDRYGGLSLSTPTQAANQSAAADPHGGLKLTPPAQPAQRQPKPQKAAPEKSSAGTPPRKQAPPTTRPTLRPLDEPAAPQKPPAKRPTLKPIDEPATPPTPQAEQPAPQTKRPTLKPIDEPAAPQTPPAQRPTLQPVDEPAAPQTPPAPRPTLKPIDEPATPPTSQPEQPAPPAERPTLKPVEEPAAPQHDYQPAAASMAAPQIPAPAPQQQFPTQQWIGQHLPQQLPQQLPPQGLPPQNPYAPSLTPPLSVPERPAAPVNPPVSAPAPNMATENSAAMAPQAPAVPAPNVPAPSAPVSAAPTTPFEMPPPAVESTPEPTIAPAAPSQSPDSSVPVSYLMPPSHAPDTAAPAAASPATPATDLDFREDVKQEDREYEAEIAVRREAAAAEAAAAYVDLSPGGNPAETQPFVPSPASKRGLKDDEVVVGAGAGEAYELAAAEDINPFATGQAAQAPRRSIFRSPAFIAFIVLTLGLMFTGGLTFLVSPFIGKLFTVLLMVLCVLVAFSGEIWGITKVWRRTPSKLALYLFVPFYRMFYQHAHRKAMQGPFALTVVGVLMSLGCVAILALGPEGDRQTAGNNGGEFGSSGGPDFSNDLDPFAPNENFGASNRRGAIDRPEEPAEPVTIVWNVAADTAPAAANVEVADISIAIPRAGEVAASAWPHPYILVGSDFEDVWELWDVSAGRRAAVIRGDLSLRKPFAVSDDGKLLAGLSSDDRSRVDVYSFDTGRAVGRLATQGFRSINFLQFTSPEEIFIAGDRDGDGKLAEVWHVTAQRGLRELDGLDDFDDGTLGISNGRRYAAAARDGGRRVVVYELQTGALVGDLRMGDSSEFRFFTPKGTAFSNDGRTLAMIGSVSGGDSRVVTIDTTTGRVAGNQVIGGQFDTFHNEARPLQWLSNDGSWLLGGQKVVNRFSGAVIANPFAGESSFGRREYSEAFGNAIVYTSSRGHNEMVVSKRLAGGFDAPVAAAANQGGANELEQAIDADLTAAKQIALNAAAWSAPPDPALGSGLSLGRKYIELDIPFGQTGRIRLASPDVGQAVVAARLQGEDEPAGNVSYFGTRRFNRLDLASCERMGEFNLPATCGLADLTLSGEQLLTIDEKSRRRVDVWTAGGEHVIGWEPYAAGAGNGQNVAQAAMIDTGRAATISETGELVVWDAANARAVYRAKFAPGSVFARSPGARWIAAFDGAALYVLDAQTGEVRGSLILPGARSARMLTASFRKDGEELAVVVQSPGDRPQVVHIDVREGSVLSQFAIGFEPTQADFCDRGYLLTDFGFVIDLAANSVVWRYGGESQAVKAPVAEVGRDGRAWFVAGGLPGEPGYLLATALPDAQLRQRLSTAFGPQAEKVLGAGVNVSIDFSGPAAQNDGGARAAAVEQFAGLLRGAGLSPAPGQRTTLAIKVNERKSTQTITRSTGRPFGGGGPFGPRPFPPGIPRGPIGPPGGAPNVQTETIEKTIWDCSAALIDPRGDTIWEEKKSFDFTNGPAGGPSPQAQWQAVGNWANSLTLPMYVARVGGATIKLPDVSLLRSTVPQDRQPPVAARQIAGDPGSARAVGDAAMQEAGSRKPLAWVGTGDSEAECVAINPANPAQVATGNWWGVVKVFDFQEREMLHNIEVDGSVEQLVFTSDGQKLMVRSRDAITFIDVARQRPKPKAISIRGSDAAALVPDGSQFAVSASGTIGVFDGRTGKIDKQLTRATSPYKALAYSPDGLMLAASRPGDKVVEILDPATGSVLKELSGDHIEVSHLDFSGDGSKLAGGTRDEVLIWDVATWRELASVKRSGDKGVCISNDGSVVVAVGFPHAVVANGETGAVLFDMQQRINGVDISPNGQAFVTVNGDKTLNFWSANTDPNAPVTIGAPLAPSADE